jgi:hypothetical protein
MTWGLSLWCEVRCCGLVQLFRLEESKADGDQARLRSYDQGPNGLPSVTILAQPAHTGTHTLCLFDSARSMGPGPRAKALARDDSKNYFPARPFWHASQIFVGVAGISM